MTEYCCVKARDENVPHSDELCLFLKEVQRGVESLTVEQLRLLDDIIFWDFKRRGARRIGRVIAAKED